jgi:hypothetical protein
MKTEKSSSHTPRIKKGTNLPRCGFLHRNRDARVVHNAEIRCGVGRGVRSFPNLDGIDMRLYDIELDVDFQELEASSKQSDAVNFGATSGRSAKLTNSI